MAAEGTTRKIGNDHSFDVNIDADDTKCREGTVILLQ
jgi:hypothetical protein